MAVSSTGICLFHKLMFRVRARFEVVQIEQQCSIIPSTEGASLVHASPCNFSSYPPPTVPDMMAGLSPGVLPWLSSSWPGE